MSSSASSDEIAASDSTPSSLSTDEILSLDQQHVWHPYAAVPNAVPCFPVQRAFDCTIELTNGQKLIDGMSSWWACIHGYNHAYLNEAAIRQMTESTSHIMFGGLTHEPAVKLAETLVSITPKPLEHVFYADSGSVAIEVAMKMALQYYQNRSNNNSTKHKFLSVRGGYHGDTFHAMSVCDPVTGMHHLFSNVLQPQLFVDRPETRYPGTSSSSDVERTLERDVAKVQKILEDCAHEIVAIILEPIVQGAGGMHFYHPDYLRRIRSLCDDYDVLLIADEIATGFGRTGKLFACHHTAMPPTTTTDHNVSNQEDYQLKHDNETCISPDILCLGKALTGGFMSFAATLTTKRVAQGICQDGNVFMHGPTFMGNPLACSVALASFQLLQNSKWQTRVQGIEQQLRNDLLDPCRQSPLVKDVRVMGAIGVVEMKEPLNMKTVQPWIVDQNVWLRPFGRLLYCMPPFIIKQQELRQITNVMVQLAHKLPK